MKRLHGVNPAENPVYMRLQSNPLVKVVDLNEIKGAIYFAVWQLPAKVMTVLEQAHADALTPGLLEQRIFRMMGKETPFPRLNALVAGKEEVAKGIKYAYSGGKDVAKLASEAQLTLLDYLNVMVGYEENDTFNSFLLNYYHLGEASSIGRHQDSESDLAEGSLVAGFSWIENPQGNNWMFRLRSVQNLDMSGKKPKAKWVNVKLEHGQCFCMGGPLFQDTTFGWSHEIPKGSTRWSHPGTRLSFTARRLIAPVKRKRKNKVVSGAGVKAVDKRNTR
jgi:alkylated DNA repair dioxygenase AlkB